jgi:hypothetical protein
MVATPEESRLLRNQRALLATTLRLVSRDRYTFWHLQETPTEKVLLAVKRLDEKWSIMLDHRARSHRRDARDLPPETWENYVIDEIVNAIVAGWDHYGAPNVAKAPEGGYIGSAEGPDGGFIVHAESKRRAYELARREWLRRILAVRLGLGKGE